jgi:hypothetical protein
MTVQTINIGNVVNDGLGDDLRTAFQKVNANFAELFYIGNITAANTIGNAGFGLFKEKADIPNSDGTTTSTLIFRTLLQGDNIRLSPSTNTIRVDSIDPPAFNQIAITDDSSVINAQPLQRGIILNSAPAPGVATRDIEITSLGNAITIKTLFPFTEKLTNYDFGSAIGMPANVIELFFQVSNIDLGTVDRPSGLNFDFGELDSQEL